MIENEYILVGRYVTRSVLLNGFTDTRHVYEPSS